MRILAHSFSCSLCNTNLPFAGPPRLQKNCRCGLQRHRSCQLVCTVYCILSKCLWVFACGYNNLTCLTGPPLHQTTLTLPLHHLNDAQISQGRVRAQMSGQSFLSGSRSSHTRHHFHQLASSPSPTSQSCAERCTTRLGTICSVTKIASTCYKIEIQWFVDIIRR